MIEIDDIIELQTNTETERLSFATQYLVYENFTFRLSVVSNSFCGISSFCVRRDELALFCEQLSNMYTSLSGSANVTDNDSDSFIALNAKQSGHIIVNGQVGGSSEDHFMKFRFQTDQTCISKLITDFKALLLHQYY